jgi:hypothetical protein
MRMVVELGLGSEGRGGNERRRTREAVVTGATHRYAVGEHVEFHPPSPILEKEFAGSYSVERLLPLSDTGQVPTYKIKSLKDGHQRIAAEDDLSPI